MVESRARNTRNGQRKRPYRKAGARPEESEPRMSETERRFRKEAAKRAAKREAKMAEREAARGGAPKQKRPGILRRTLNEWTDRLLGAAKDGGLSKQEAEYEGHRTKADYVWNTAGLAAFGVVFPLLTIVVTQLCGAEQAGRFSLAFVTGQLLVIIANYGIRTYQVSDVEETRSFSEYQVNRWITCIAMLLIGYAYCSFRGYDSEMFTMFMWVFVYRMTDGLADVYEGRLQQMDKLYLAGISQTVRSALAFLACTIMLLITHNLALASIAMGVVALASFVLVTFPLALLETPKSRRMTFGGVGQLFKDGFPVFLALFLYAFIDNMPKFVMEGVLTYDNQLYFNALYFPAQSILMTVGFIYKPMLVRIANAWADPSRRRRFDLFVVAMIALIAAITAIGILFMGWIGLPIMSFLYGLDFEQFRVMSYVMLVTGGITGVIDFLYQVITVMRHQRDVMKLYVLTFGFSLFVPYLMVHTAGLNGAIDGYMIVMAILAALLIMEYASVRYSYAKHPERDPNNLEGSPLESKGTRRVRRGAPARTATPRRRTDARPSVRANAQGQAPVQRRYRSGEVVRFDEDAQVAAKPAPKAAAPAAIAVVPAAPTPASAPAPAAAPAPTPAATPPEPRPSKTVPLAPPSASDETVAPALRNIPDPRNPIGRGGEVDLTDDDLFGE